MVCTGNVDVEQEADEVPVVEVPNAIVDPWAVMVWNEFVRGGELNCIRGAHTHTKYTSV